MLIYFRVKNYKSFEKQVDFSMVKGGYRLKNERVETLKNLNVLKMAAIFGANASGKSNLVFAMKLMQSLVLSNIIPANDLNEYFRLNEESQKGSTYFEAVVSFQEKFYSYGFEVSLTTNVFYSE